jgi:hypothetical protein
MATPTQEQLDIVHYLQNNDGILAVNAGAGDVLVFPSNLCYNCCILIKER